jgi:hypothetical protein
MLTGCAAIAPDNDASLSGSASVTCTAETDCIQKWQRANEWVHRHSYWPIKRSDDAVIETERARSRWYSRTHYRVIKETTSNNMAEIRMEASCQPSAYCSPNTEQARAAFVQYLQTGEDRDALH